MALHRDTNASQQLNSATITELERDLEMVDIKLKIAELTKRIDKQPQDHDDLNCQRAKLYNKAAKKHRDNLFTEAPIHGRAYLQDLINLCTSEKGLYGRNTDLNLVNPYKAVRNISYARSLQEVSRPILVGISGHFAVPWENVSPPRESRFGLYSLVVNFKHGMLNASSVDSLSAVAHIAMPCYKERKASQGDLLRQNPEESSRIFPHSQSTWRSLLSIGQATSHFPDSCSNIRALLHKTPAIPDSSSVTETVKDGRLFLEGCSQWKIRSMSDCELTSKLKRSCPQTVIIGELQPTFCKLSDTFLPRRTGLDTTSDALPTGNYLYINEADKLSYTDNKATLRSIESPAPEHGFLIPVGDADERELQWWAAILAKGRGWRAALNRSDRENSSPWACHLSDDRSLAILHNGPEFTPACSLEPPSSMRAQCYLLRLAQMHDAVEHLIAAFAAALTHTKTPEIWGPCQSP
ncbi:uncharacterized protein PADG_12367 [Paracoccidioides brasiliensis Pb18]|uniref:Uncharacterized protein n=1 Tax=Paracoccidioides brasiliensis (strain Pb18) TaxID=502780 RepID=A0A0A0HQK1_PARBD|nr:uncharacterized protein PADG_12367 [Paracoccidioides brasiliensis Pb18]KGM91509.1 hypothetical protein PADG_12367 [Paracoccidioides brasiliensis Pb18]